MEFDYTELARFFDNLGAYLFARQGDLGLIEEQLPLIEKYLNDRSSIKEKDIFIEKMSKISKMLGIVRKHVDYIKNKIEKPQE